MRVRGDEGERTRGREDTRVRGHEGERIRGREDTRVRANEFRCVKGGRSLSKLERHKAKRLEEEEAQLPQGMDSM